MRANPRSAPAALLQPNDALPIYRTGSALWQQLLAFGVGFSIQFNVLIGGGGGGDLATGGYGYRLTDFVAVGALGLLGLFSIAPHRIVVLGLFGLIVAALFGYPMLSSDQRSVILAEHYGLYSFAGLFIAVILNQPAAVERFCWGLILGVLATVPIFVLLNFGYTAKLIDWGLVPGYFRVTGVFTSDVLRYTGLWGHPNEAGHVAALSAAAGAYLAFVHRRFLPFVIVGVSLLIIFYYTMSRGGLVAGGVGLFIPLLFAARRLELSRLIVMAVAIATVMLVLPQFVTSRFEDDPNGANNITDRIDSTLYGLHLLLTHPFGVGTYDLFSLISSGTGGVGSVHNGFVFFGAIFGLLPLIAFSIAFVANLRVRDETDVFFAILVIQIAISFLFETLPTNYSYAFILCIVFSRALLKTRLGALLTASPEKNARRKPRGIISGPRPPSL